MLMPSAGAVPTSGALTEGEGKSREKAAMGVIMIRASGAGTPA